MILRPGASELMIGHRNPSTVDSDVNHESGADTGFVKGGVQLLEGDARKFLRFLNKN